MSNLQIPNVTLHNGLAMPIVGLGTWEVNKSPECEEVIEHAIDIGYLHIDTAFIYYNEKLIGTKLQEIYGKTNIKRENLFITSKLPPTKVHSEEMIRETFFQSLSDLQTDYVDCYLIHWPGTSKLKVNSDQNGINRLATWRALENLYREGKAKSIGVSNFTLKHMNELLEDIKSRDNGIIPHVNQIEYHPLLYKTHKELEKLCKENNIVIQAYSPLAHGELMTGKYGEVTSRECLQWILQKGHVILPRSVKRNHMEDNFKAVTDFAAGIIDDQTRLSRLDSLVSDEVRVCWDPEQIA